MRMRSHVGGGLPPIGPQDHQRFSDRRHFLRQPKKSSGQASAFSFLEAVEVPLLPQGKKRRSPACCFSWVGAGNVADLKSGGGLEGAIGDKSNRRTAPPTCERILMLELGQVWEGACPRLALKATPPLDKPYPNPPIPLSPRFAFLPHQGRIACLAWPSSV